jgi:glycosyltransferase involved in cell wall biosynthesis
MTQSGPVATERDGAEFNNSRVGARSGPGSQRASLRVRPTEHPLPSSANPPMPITPLPLSAVLITYNTGDQLAACLRSLAFADEIVVVDSGSDDATRDVARRHGARVVDEPWRGFGPQKRFAVSLARNDWVLCIDADEEVSASLASAIGTVLASPRHIGYRMPRANRFMGRYLAHGEGFPDWSLRLFDRRRAQWSDDAVHEKVVASGSVGRLPERAVLMHHSAESLAVYLDKQNRYTSLQADALFRAGERANVWRLLLSPALRFVKFYFVRAGFLDGLPGLVHIAIGCFNSFAKYAKLRALQIQHAAEAKRGAEPVESEPLKDPA